MIEVKKKSISGSLTHKNLEISHFEIFPDALLQHGIPLLIKKGSIKNVSIQMPTKLKTDPVSLKVESITILCSVCTHDPIPEEIKTMKFHKLKAYKLFRRRYKMILDLFHKESFFSVVRTINSNLNMEINHIHIQIEYSSKSKFDLTIPNFLFPTPPSKSSKNKPTQIPKDLDDHDDKQDSEIDLFDSSFNKSSDDDQASEESSDSSEETLTFQRFSSYQDYLIVNGNQDNTDNNPKQTQEKLTSIGITISKLSLRNSGNSKESSNKKFTKDVFFTNFGIYMDVGEPPIDLSSIEKCEAELHNLFNSQKHNWILQPFSFYALLKFEKDNPQLFFEPVIKKILVNLKEEYIPVIINLLKSIDDFQRRFSVAHIPKPPFDDSMSLWTYVHKCAVTKISNATFDFSKSLNLLVKRFVYLKNYKKKNSKSRSIIKSLEEELEYSTIVAFRSAYRLIHHKKRKGKNKSKITAKTTEKIIKEIRVDPVHFVTKIVEMFSLHFSGDLLEVILTRNNDQKHISFEFKSPHLIIEKDLKSVLINIDISHVCVRNVDEIVFDTLDNDKVKLKANVKVPFQSYSNLIVSIDASNNEYTLNMKPLFQILTDIQLIKHFTETTIKSLLQLFPKKKLDFNIQIFSSVFKMFASNHSHAIQLDINKFYLFSDQRKSEEIFKFDKSIISLINDNNETKITSDFSFNGSLNENNVNISVPLFNCSFPLKYIDVLEDFINLFLKYQFNVKVSSFPKINCNLLLDMEGINVKLSQLNSNKTQIIQIRQILLSFKDFILNFNLSLIEIPNLFKLNNFTVFEKDNSSKLRISNIYIKVMELIDSIPKNALILLQNKSKNLNKTENTFDYVSESNTRSETTTTSTSTRSDKSINLHKIKIGFEVDNFEADFTLTEAKQINMNVKDIKALFDKDKFDVSAILNAIRIEDQSVLLNQMSFQLEALFRQVIEIKMDITNCDLNLRREIINYFLNLNLPLKYNFELPKDIQLKLSLKLNQITMIEDLKIKNISIDVNYSNSILNALLNFDSIESDFLKLNSKSSIQMDFDVNNKSIDLNAKLAEITISTVQFIQIITKLPRIDFPTPEIKLKLIIEKQLRCNLCICDESLNVIFDSPVKFKFDNVNKEIPSFYLRITDFLINLNNNELLSMQYFKFTLDKNITINIPSIYIKLTMFKIYTILKMLPNESSLPIALPINSKSNLLIYQLPIQSILVQIPLIQITICKTNSKRCISLTFDNTELYLKNSNQKSEMFATTKVLFDAFNGFLSYHLASPFIIVCNGEFSETTNNCIFEAKNPIKFEISTYVINQILQNLTIKEDESEQEYSISNETGSNVSIIINKDIYELKTNQSLPNVPNFVGSDINLKIEEISNPIKVYSSFSKIAYPLFFGDYFILLWMDVKRLQLRLLSPICFKNKSNIDLKVQFLNREYELSKNEVYFVNYKINKLSFITVKLDNDKQRIQLNEEYAIKLTNKYIVVSKNRKIETLQTKITFRTPYYFRNELISNLSISLKEINQEILLKSCEIVPIPYFKPFSDVISFDIEDTIEFKGFHADLKFDEFNENGQVITTIDKNGNPFALQFTFVNKKHKNIISISTLLIIYNSLSIPLIFSLDSEDKIEKEKFFDISILFPVKNSEDIWEVDNPIMISPLIKDIKNISIFISTKYSNQWPTTPITMSDFDTIDDLMIPINDEILSLAHFHLLTHCNLRPNTFVFFISPKYFINNQTDETFSLSFIEGKSIEISPNSMIPVTIIRNSLKFSISIVPPQQTLKKPNLIYSHKINIETISSQFVKLHSIDSPILLQSSSKKEIHFITILFKQTLPYLFVNNTNLKVIFVQKDTPDYAHVVMPHESLSFFIYDENMPTIIFCEIANHIKIELDVNEPSFPVKIETNDNNQSNLYYYVDLSRIEGSTITLCNIVDDEISIKSDIARNSSINYRIFMGLASHFDESSLSFSLNSLPQLEKDALNLSFNFGYISVLIITSQYQEMCRLTLKDVMIDSSIYDFSTEIQISVGLIKVDDQNQYAIYPSVFQILPVGNKRAIRFSFNCFGSHKYGKIEFDIRPIIARIDLSFISDFIVEIFYFHNNYRKNKFELKMNDIQITEIIRDLMPKQYKYHINRISINPFNIHLSFLKISNRSNHPFQTEFQFNRLINFIPSFDHISLTIEDSHFFRNLSGTPDEIIFEISYEIKKLILQRLYRKINILGSRKMVKNDVDKTIKKRFFNKIISLLSIAENTLSYISSMMDLYIDSPPSFRTDETSIGALSWGFSSFLSSFKNGAKQLISETEKRGKINGKDDYCGYIVGFGIGVFKCAACCLSGFCSLNSSLFSCTKRIFVSDNFIFIDERECEPSLGLHCSDCEKLLWYTGSVSSGLIEVYSHSIFILDDNLFIQNIQRAEKVENCVNIYDENQNKFISSFENENQANHFFNIVESQLLRKKIIESEKPITKLINDTK